MLGLAVLLILIFILELILIFALTLISYYAPTAEGQKETSCFLFVTFDVRDLSLNGEFWLTGEIKNNIPIFVC